MNGDTTRVSKLGLFAQNCVLHFEDAKPGFWVDVVTVKSIKKSLEFPPPRTPSTHFHAVMWKNYTFNDR